MEKKLILSLDGGGVKGVMVSRFLEHLDEAMAGHPYRKKVGSGSQILREFDMIAGTSTGALIAGALCYSKCSAHELVSEIYSRKNAQKMMPYSFCQRLMGMVGPGPKYSGVGKNEVIHRYIPKNVLMSSSKSTHVLLTGYDLHTLRPKFFKSYDRDCDFYVGRACDISSAAPVYYPGVEAVFPKIPGTVVGVDGGVFANDPSDCAYADSLKLFGKENDIRVLSIGCGRNKREEYGTSIKKARHMARYGGASWLTKGHLLDVLMDAPLDCVKYRMEKFTEALNHRYLRVNIELENTSMDDISEKNINILREKGTEMWKNNGVAVLDFLFT